MIRKHIDFDLWIGLDDVRARCSGKEARAEIELAPFEKEMEELARTLQQDSEVSGSELGKRLYDAVFVKQVRDLMAVNLPPKGSKRGLRLRLRLHRKVSGWPWELLNTGRSFLALSVKTPVVRDVAGIPFPVLRTAWPIRVLVVVPSPPGPPALDADKEVADIREALSWREALGLVKIEKLEPPTLAALQARLDGGQFHVLHFIGHGTFLQHRGQGALLFEDADGKADLVDGERLAGVLDDDESLRLIILNACNGARGTADDLFAGVAQSLARQGIPAVVGMQYPIYDDMALAFSRRFYGALSRARRVDWALARARQAMLAAGKGLDWAIPALFLSSSDGRLFRWKPSRGLLGAIGMILLMFPVYGSWRSRVAALGPTPALGYAASYCPPGPRSLKMEFARIHPEPFLMGSEAGEDNEKPVHEVTISRQFCIGKFEVTQRQWKQVMGANSVQSKQRGDDLPVTMVTYEDVQGFLRKLNELEGRPIYRLATEAEWELAATGEGGGFNCRGDRQDGLLPVGTFPVNGQGVHDMLGNAWEWVQDWEGPYLGAPIVDPQGPSSGTKRIKRGGSYDAAPANCRPARRNSHKPDGRANDLGFRLVREVRPAA